MRRLRYRAGPQVLEQLPPGRRHVLDSLIEGHLVRFRRRIEAADLADELQGRAVELLVGGLLVRAAESFDVSAHEWVLFS